MLSRPNMHEMGRSEGGRGLACMQWDKLVEFFCMLLGSQYVAV